MCRRRGAGHGKAHVQGGAPEPHRADAGSARGAHHGSRRHPGREVHAVADGLNLEAFSAEYLSLLKKTFETNRELGLGRVQELTVFTENLIAIIKAVTNEYYMVFALPPHGNFGQARFELRKSVLRLAKELS